MNCKKPIYITQYLPLILTLFLTACGFHLRGSVNIPSWFDTIFISSNNENKELNSALKVQFKSYKIHVTNDPRAAHYWLIINSANFRQQILSVGASTNPRQYQLILTIGYTLQTPKGQILTPPLQINVTRQLIMNNNRILGSNAEESILKSEMYQDAVRQMLNRLTFIKV